MRIRSLLIPATALLLSLKPVEPSAVTTRLLEPNLALPAGKKKCNHLKMTSQRVSRDFFRVIIRRAALFSVNARHF
jgi:hypothetical protein